MPRILLAEDDQTLRVALCDMLQAEHYDVYTYSHGDDALDQALNGSYDLILLDVLLPGLNGYDIAAQVRQHKIPTPIIMITAKDRVDDRVQGLDAGADDYLVKPFALTELHARIRAQLRRSALGYQESDVLEFDNMRYRFATRELTIGSQTLALSPKEALLMELFLRYPHWVLTRQQLMDRLWGEGTEILDNALEAHISKLRRRLVACGGPDIVAVRGLGYRLGETV
ncbi:response regulator transcription factor [Sulfobacillus thermosulfidooxidans]|uniref:response regulator transcription factor n=1 Tax=Sulfobacillus thermosulfidooxidans TaxID=28034 RepID=UPI0003FA0271|nr:response regulator transcription factor [Sulfobacillus thermosulfidooxidans]